MFLSFNKPTQVSKPKNDKLKFVISDKLNIKLNLNTTFINEAKYTNVKHTDDDINIEFI